MARFRDMFMSSQEAVAAGLAGEDVTVLFDAKGAPCADLKNRIMHLRPLPEEMSPIDLEDCRGDADHETGHFRFTSLSALESSRRCNFLKLLINIVEDGRIERLVSARWYGCAENLANSGSRALERMHENSDGSESDRRRRTMAGLTLLAFGHSRSKVLRMVGEDTDELFKEIDDLLPGVESLPTTHDVVSLCEKIRERWIHWADKEPPPPAEGGKGEKSEEEDGGGDESPGGDSSGKKKEGKKGSKKKITKVVEKKAGDEPDDAPGAEGEGEKEDKPEKEKAKSGKAKSKSKSKKKKPTKAEIKDLVKSLEDCALADIRKDMIREKVFSSRKTYTACTEQDVIKAIETDHVRWATEDAFYSLVKKTVPVLRRKTLMEFRGIGKKVTRGQRKGRLDDRNVFKVALGSDRVFQRTLPVSEVNASVQLLIDCSGSMQFSNRLKVAAACAAAMSQTLDGIGVDHEALAFTSRRFYDSKRANKAMKTGRYQRTCPLKHLIVKSSKSTFRQSRKNFAALSNYQDTMENVDGEAVMWAANRMMQSAKDGAKPVLIVFSDGSPASSFESFKVLNSHLKRSVERIESAGISVIGVGIQTACVEEFYKNNVVVHNLSDMAGEFFTILRKVLKETSTIRR